MTAMKMSFFNLISFLQVPVLKIPRKKISIENSSDILRYVYSLQLADNPEQVKFLEPTAESLKWERKLDKMGEDLRRSVYYQVILIINK